MILSACLHPPQLIHSFSVHLYPHSDIWKSTDILPDFAQTALRLDCLIDEGMVIKKVCGNRLKGLSFLQGII